MCFIVVWFCYVHRTWSAWLARDWGTIMDCMRKVSLARKSPGAQLWIVCAWSAWLARDRGHGIGQYVHGHPGSQENGDTVLGK